MFTLIVTSTLPCSSFWSVSVLMVERPPMLLKITESRPRKSAVSPVYSSPPEEGQGRNSDQLNVKCTGNTERVRVSDL